MLLKVILLIIGGIIVFYGYGLSQTGGGSTGIVVYKLGYVLIMIGVIIFLGVLFSFYINSTYHKKRIKDR